mmetsp:Transcript_26600/g.52984  ORF Transcript_26600/g.52984 Transcript_26600/m.52984 type:complete len:216 (-) Transcript_26600:64-711(-)
MKGASLILAILLATSVLPHPVGPIIRTFRGVISRRRSSAPSPSPGAISRRRHRFLRAMATAFFASAWPTMWRSREDTTSEGFREGLWRLFAGVGGSASDPDSAAVSGPASASADPSPPSDGVGSSSSAPAASPASAAAPGVILTSSTPPDTTPSVAFVPAKRVGESVRPRADARGRNPPTVDWHGALAHPRHIIGRALAAELRSDMAVSELMCAY